MSDDDNEAILARVRALTAGEPAAPPSGFPAGDRAVAPASAPAPAGVPALVAPPSPAAGAPAAPSAGAPAPPPPDPSAPDAPPAQPSAPLTAAPSGTPASDLGPPPAGNPSPAGDRDPPGIGPAEPAPTLATAPADFRRRVFYIPGYDPIHPRRYRELYRKEGAAQAALSGYSLALAPRPKGAAIYGWHVEARIEDRLVRAEVDVLVWSDIVRDSMSGSIPATYWQLVRTAALYIGTGTLRRLMWLRRGPVIAALYPVAMLLVQLFAAVAFGAVAGTVAARLMTLAAGALETGEAVLPRLAFWVLALPVAVWLLRWFKSRDGKLYAYYLMHDYAYSASKGGANPLPLEARMAEFGEAIAGALASDVDEVLVVGHSSGAHLAVSILADLIRAGRVSRRGPALGFLSLGQVIPMVSFLPRATRLRADLAYLSRRDELAWVDVTAPGDGCAFALCDPVAVSGVQPSDARWPLVVSAAFTRTLRPETWAKLRRRYFRLHFQYLCAFDNLPGSDADYDYFRVTAGPQTLGRRFADRAPSKSRIDVPASKYTTVAA